MKYSVTRYCLSFTNKPVLKTFIIIVRKQQACAHGVTCEREAEMINWKIVLIMPPLSACGKPTSHSRPTVCKWYLLSSFCFVQCDGFRVGHRFTVNCNVHYSTDCWKSFRRLLCPTQPFISTVFSSLGPRWTCCTVGDSWEAKRTIFHCFYDIQCLVACLYCSMTPLVKGLDR